MLPQRREIRWEGSAEGRGDRKGWGGVGLRWGGGGREDGEARMGCGSERAMGWDGRVSERDGMPGC